MIHFPILTTIRRNITFETGEEEGKQSISLLIASGPSILRPHIGTLPLKILN
jgi:hypothetical protein